MPMLKVGELYNPRRTQWPETPHVRMGADGVELVVFLAGPTSAEVRDARNGVPQLAWVDAEHTGILAYRLGAQPWQDAPYHPHLDQPGGLPEGTLCTVILVDAATGIVRALRQLGLPGEFLDRLRASLRRMLDTPFSQQSYLSTIDGLYARYPSTADMVRERADLTCSPGRADTRPGIAGRR